MQNLSSKSDFFTESKTKFYRGRRTQSRRVEGIAHIRESGTQRCLARGPEVGGKLYPRKRKGNNPSDSHGAAQNAGNRTGSRL